VKFAACCVWKPAFFRRLYSAMPEVSVRERRPEDNNANTHQVAMPAQHKTSRHELTPIERAYLVGRHDAGDSFDKISHQTGISKSTIADHP
jgi:hypothetical protein